MHQTNTGFVCHHCRRNNPAQANFCGGCGRAQRTGSISSGLKGASLRSVVAASFFALVLFVVVGIPFGLFSQNTRATNKVETPQAPPRILTVQEYLHEQVPSIERNLNVAGGAFAKYIEHVHATVTFRGASVRSVRGITIDGSNSAGAHGSNVSDVTFVVTAYWDGLVQKGGFTELEMTYDNRTGRTKGVQFLKSNAVVNLETINWLEVFLVGVQVVQALSQ